MVLICCEESQTVCKAFRAVGIEAYSNDLQECSGGRPDWHLQMDCVDAIKLKKWEMIGLHPECTKIALSGNRHYAFGKNKHTDRLEAVEWTLKLWRLACNYSANVYMENPMGAMNKDSRLPRPQIVQPYYFGDEAQKTTCLWLHGLQPLQHDPAEHVGRGEMVTFKSGKVMAKWFADTSSTNSESNRRLRSKTFPGIARAMADQWALML